MAVTIPNESVVDEIGEVMPSSKSNEVAMFHVVVENVKQDEVTYQIEDLNPMPSFKDGNHLLNVLVCKGDANVDRDYGDNHVDGLNDVDHDRDELVRAI